MKEELPHLRFRNSEIQNSEIQKFRMSGFLKGGVQFLYKFRKFFSPANIRMINGFLGLAHPSKVVQ